MTVVTAIIVTYRRPQVLASTLAAVASQERRPDRVLIVDNSDTASQVAQDAGADYVATGDNGGIGFGLAVGMQHVETTDWLWLMDDDSQAAPHALGSALEHAVPGVGAVGFSGGRLNWGIPRRTKVSEPCDADYLELDGTIVNAEAVRAVGVPRSDFFMMFETVEFTERIRRGGWRLVLLPEAITRQHLGSKGTPPWRAYYQTRNHLRLALERHDPRLIAGWAARTVHMLLVQLRGSNGRTVARMRLLGAWHGLRGRMGRVIDPS